MARREKSLGDMNRQSQRISALAHQLGRNDIRARAHDILVRYRNNILNANGITNAPSRYLQGGLITPLAISDMKKSKGIPSNVMKENSQKYPRSVYMGTAAKAAGGVG